MVILIAAIVVVQLYPLEKPRTASEITDEKH
jgi:hypothetical protein